MSWGLGGPAMRGVRYCSSERVLGAPDLHYCSLSLTWYLGFLGFVLFLKGLEVKLPTQWQMKPSVLLQSPPCVHLSPIPCSFPAAFTQFVYVSSAFRQLQHLDVGNVTDSCTLDQPTGLPAPSQ